MPHEPFEATTLGRALGAHGVAWSRLRPHGRWFCFGCGRRGDVISFIQVRLDLAFLAPLEHIARRIYAPSTAINFHKPAVQVPERTVTRPPGVAKLWKRCLGVTRDRGLVDWLQSRGLDAKLVRDHDLARTVPAGGRFPEWLPAEWVQGACVIRCC